MITTIITTTVAFTIALILAQVIILGIIYAFRKSIIDRCVGFVIEQLANMETIIELQARDFLRD